MALLTKREFMKASLGAAAVLAAPGMLLRPSNAQPKEDHMPATALKMKETSMPFTLPDLPYAYEALEPYTSANTLRFHHDKHHAAYVKTLNELVGGTDMANLPLEEVIKKAAADKDKAKLFNNAGQVWNHNFFWQCMTPKNGGGEPKGAIKQRIEKDLGGFEQFKKDFKEAAVTQFGSGWAWLVADGGKLAIMKTGNADTPLVHGKKALLTVDVWEHAYYLDYQNRRPDFVTAFIDHLINWDFVEKNLAASAS
jgi:Fe-Mn family superoxide dismutase